MHAQDRENHTRMNTTQPSAGAQAPPLLKHQREDIAFIRRERRVLLGNEPGTGKSRSAIEATDGSKTLVVAPAMVIASGTWRDEIALWAKHPENYTVVPYSMLNARNGSRVLPKPRPEFKGPWESIIIDEAHYTKGRNTSWTNLIERLARPADCVVEMTGTPIPNWAHELFTILRVIHGHENAKPGGAYGSFWRWAERWFDCTPTRFSQGMPTVGELAACTSKCLQRPSNNPCAHYRRFMLENLGNRYRRVLRDDVLDLPPLTSQVIEVPLLGEQKRIYNDLRRHYITEIDRQEVVAWSQGAKNVMLDKVTTSPWLLNPKGEARGGKLDRLAFDLSARSAPTLVVAHYVDTVDACARVAQDIGAKVGVIHGKTSDAEAVRLFADFKGGRLDVLCASLDKVAEGAQLQQADMVIFVEISYKPYRNEQARYRIHRLGQTRACTALYYVTPNTVDARKRRLVMTKTDRQMRYLTAGEFADML